MSDRGLRPADPEAALPDPREADNVLYDPSPDRLRAFSKQLETTTEFDSPAYVSEQRSRCADRTRNAVDDAFDAADYGRVETALEAARSREMVCLDRQVGRHPEPPTAVGTTCPGSTAASRWRWRSSSSRPRRTPSRTS